MDFKTKNQNKVLRSKYLDRYFALNSQEDLARYKMFPNAKEVTESFGMVAAVERFADLDRKDESVRLFVVGDGTKPRTAALFAFLTKWKCCSIDPLLKGDYSGIKNLVVQDLKIEDVGNIEWTSDKTHVIILPHSHAPIQIAYNKLKNDRTWVFTMPCCVEHSLNLPGLVYRDQFVASAKNEIKVYCNYKTPKY